MSVVSYCAQTVKFLTGADINIWEIKKSNNNISAKLKQTIDMHPFDKRKKHHTY